MPRKSRNSAKSRDIACAPLEPAKAEQDAALDKELDVIAPDLKVLFCGIQPGRYSAAAGRFYSKSGNRFWPAMHLSGFTEKKVSPEDQQTLLDSFLGLTTLIRHALPPKVEPTPAQMREGVGVLLSKINLYKPRIVAFGGIGIFRKAFKRPDAVVGLQAESLGGALLWVLPNTSALNAGWKLNDIARAFRDLREFVERAEFAVGPDILADEVEEQKKQQAADQSDEGVDVKVEAGVNLRAEPVISAESQSEVKIEADVTIKLELEETPSTPIDLVSASPSPSPETRAPPSRIPPSPAKRKQQSQDPNPTDAEPTPSDSDSDCEEEQWRPLRATRGNKRIKVI